MPDMNPEIQGLIPPLTPEERGLLERTIAAEGWRDTDTIRFWRYEQPDGSTKLARIERLDGEGK
jgi:hypothetical protein